MYKGLFVIIGFVALSGCAANGNFSTPDNMNVATNEMVDNCKFLGDVHGVSGAYGVFAKAGLASARQEAFSQAELLGANTVVWQPFSTQYGSTSAHGNAYKCPVSETLTKSPGD